MSQRNSPPPKKTLTKEKILEEKNRLITNIEKIDIMSTVVQVEDFKAQIYKSTANERTKHYLLKACNLRLAQMHNRESLLAVNGDLDDFN